MKECELYHLHGRYYLICWDHELGFNVTYKKKGDLLINVEDETDAIRFSDVMTCKRQQDPAVGAECWYDDTIEQENGNR